MKIHLVCLYWRTYEAMVELYRQAEPRIHELVDDPDAADMILFAGRWSFYGHGVIDHPLPRKYPEKTFVYSDDDVYAALLPGVYASAVRPRLLPLNRVESQKFIDWPNPQVRPVQSKKKFLFSFAGRSSSLLRKRLFRIDFNRPDIYIENTSYYDHWKIQPNRVEDQRRYVATIAASRFALCPKGASSGSYRLFEVMQMGVAPVIISDRYIPPYGPDWASFALFVPERKIAKLAKIIEEHAYESEERGMLAVEAYEHWFASPKVFNHIVALCERIRSRRLIPERWVQPFWGLMLWRLRMVRGARGVTRSAILRGLQAVRRLRAGSPQLDA